MNRHRFIFFAELLRLCAYILYEIISHSQHP